MPKKNLLSLALSLSLLAGSYFIANITNAEAQIVIDPITKTITITGLILSTGTVTTGTTGTTTTGTISSTGSSTGVTVKTTSTIVTTASTWTEFERSLSWLYTNGLTKYDNQTDFRMYDGLTREEAAKMIAQAYIVLGYTQTTTNTNCQFTDNKLFNPELSGYILKACQRGLMKGNNGKFMPTQKLTRPEAMTILVRMFEGKVSYENQNPRRADYYLKGKALGLTTLQNTAFDKEISRYEIALYIYRFQNIVTNTSLSISAQQKIQDLGLTGTVATWTTTSTDTTSELAQKFWAIANSISVENDPELQEAIRWMNDKGLTSYSTITEYKPFEVLLREQSAKILDIFAKVFSFSQDKLTTTLPTNCQFKDISKADWSLITHIENICKMEILQGGNQIFDPKGTLTKGQFITALIRLVEGKKLDETSNPRWTNYYQSALNMGIVGPADALTFDSPITRYEVALFLYRFKIKYQMINSLNTDKLENQIINTVSGSIQQTTTIISTGDSTWTITLQTSNIFIDTNLLQNGNFELGYIEIFGNKHKVVKTSTESYFSKNFVRYGDIFDIESDKKIWTISFIVSNRLILEGTIRMTSGSNYAIEQVSETSAYYKLRQLQ